MMRAIAGIIRRAILFRSIRPLHQPSFRRASMWRWRVRPGNAALMPCTLICIKKASLCIPFSRFASSTGPFCNITVTPQVKHSDGGAME